MGSGEMEAAEEEPGVGKGFEEWEGLQCFGELP